LALPFLLCLSLPRGARAADPPLDLELTIQEKQGTRTSTGRYRFPLQRERPSELRLASLPDKPRAVLFVHFSQRDKTVTYLVRRVWAPVRRFVAPPHSSPADVQDDIDFEVHGELPTDVLTGTVRLARLQGFDGREILIELARGK
jgi:hypothetical protein